MPEDKPYTLFSELFFLGRLSGIFSRGYSPFEFDPTRFFKEINQLTTEEKADFWKSVHILNKLLPRL